MPNLVNSSVAFLDPRNNPAIPGFEGTNLVNNPDVRSNAPNLNPIIDDSGTSASFNSCYKVDTTGLTELEFGLDFGED